MYMNLLCPRCGFSFGVDVPDDISNEELLEIKTCPCGTLMRKTEKLHAIWFVGDEAEKGEE